MAVSEKMLPFSYSNLEKEAELALSKEPFTYVQSGAGAEITLCENETAFNRWAIVPRVLKDVSSRVLSTDILGTHLPASFILAPIGNQGILHPEGELASARAAAAFGVPFIASTVSTFSLEEIAAANGTGSRWFQLYWSSDFEVTASLVHRAEKAGYTAITVTVDMPVVGYRERDLDHQYFPLALGKGAANFLQDPIFLSRLSKPPAEDMTGALAHLQSLFFTPSLTWEKVKKLREITSLPIIIKGVLHEEDARKAVDAGFDGIVVSNHGGRQLDGCISSLDALSPIVTAVAGKIPVMLDSGIRRGADVVKALALGADAVLLGRPYVYGLAVGGENGVKHVIEQYIKDVDTAVALTGLTAVSEANRGTVRKVN
ncbi:alpha-hydroxy-acid oxidizing protein [Fictibacillus iocasae]|uniref:L-lactate oxidase n=1 Tax=Fictibacillus iocasae TaxID=2715437 RepID=A0ABW2NR98_9BACL